jgi:sulfite dehydrogenase (cytochrome) subunit B
MKRAAAAGCGVLLALAASARGAQPPGELTGLKDGPGHDVTTGRCIICHSLEYIPNNAPALDRTGWQKEIQKMRERFGAPITDAEAQQILEYLATNYSGKAGG